MAQWTATIKRVQTAPDEKVAVTVDYTNKATGVITSRTLLFAPDDTRSSVAQAIVETGKALAKRNTLVAALESDIGAEQVIP